MKEVVILYSIYFNWYILFTSIIIQIYVIGFALDLINYTFVLSGVNITKVSVFDLK